MILKTFGPQELVCPHPGAIYVYMYTAYCNNIQRSSSLKPLDQSKPNLMRNIYKRGTNLFINNPGHMSKMAHTSIKHFKIFLSGNDEKISRKLGL